MKPRLLTEAEMPIGLKYVPIKPAEGTEDHVDPITTGARMNDHNELEFWTMIEITDQDIEVFRKTGALWFVQVTAQVVPFRLDHVIKTTELGSMLCHVCEAPVPESEQHYTDDGRFGHGPCFQEVTQDAASGG